MNESIVVQVVVAVCALLVGSGLGFAVARRSVSARRAEDLIGGDLDLPAENQPDTGGSTAPEADHREQAADAGEGDDGPGADRCAELEARVAELEPQLLRFRRWATAQLKAMSDQLEQSWDDARLPRRFHQLPEDPDDELCERLDALAGPLDRWSEELGMDTTEIRFQIGLWHALEGRTERAARCFHNAAQMGMGGEAWLAEGDALHALGRPVKAARAYRECLHLKDLPDHVVHRLARIDASTGRWAEVLTRLDPLLNRRTTGAEVFALASLAAGKLQQDERAVEICERGLKAHPGAPLLESSMIIPLHRLGETGRAEELFTRVTETAPELAEAHFAMGVTRLHDGDDAAAEELFEQALMLRETYPEAYFCLGVIANRRNDFKTALGHFKRAIELKPDYAEAHYHIRDTYEGLKDYESAIAAMNRAVQLNPDLE